MIVKNITDKITHKKQTKINKNIPPHTHTHTCCHEGREHPTLPILDRLVPVGHKFLQDPHTATPHRGCHSVRVLPVPAASQHTVIITLINLDKVDKDKVRFCKVKFRSYTVSRLSKVP